MVSNGKDKKIESFSRKLDIIIGLLYDLRESLTIKNSIKEKVAYFSNEYKEMNNKEISRALGISEKHVSKEKTLLKKK